MVTTAWPHRRDDFTGALVNSVSNLPGSSSSGFGHSGRSGAGSDTFAASLS